MGTKQLKAVCLCDSDMKQIWNKDVPLSPSWEHRGIPLRGQRSALWRPWHCEEPLHNRPAAQRPKAAAGASYLKSISSSSRALKPKCHVAPRRERVEVVGASWPENQERWCRVKMFYYCAARGAARCRQGFSKERTRSIWDSSQGPGCPEHYAVDSAQCGLTGPTVCSLTDDRGSVIQTEGLLVVRQEYELQIRPDLNHLSVKYSFTAAFSFCSLCHRETTAAPHYMNVNI